MSMFEDIPVEVGVIYEGERIRWADAHMELGGPRGERKFELVKARKPDKVNALFGLDNVEEPLIWQRFIAQSMLAMRETDPSFGASYPPTVPGAYIIPRNHLKGFKVPAK